MADPTSVPESALAWIASTVGTVLTLFGAVVGWNYRETVKTVKGHGAAIGVLQVEASTLKADASKFACTADLERDFVRRAEFMEMEVRVAGLASRRELIAYMREHRAQQEKWEAQQQRQHDQNQETMREIKEASLLRDKHAQEFRTEMRDAIGAVNKTVGDLAVKVAAVSAVQEVQRSQGS